MIARWLVQASMPLIALTYKAWGRWWLTDDQCRRIVTAIMRATLWLARATEEREHDEQD